MKQLIALVTGGNGFLGSYVVEELLRRGYEVRCLVREKSDLRWLKPYPQIQYFHYGFCCRNNFLRAISGADVIIDAAGVTASKTKKGFFEGNYERPRKLFEHARVLARKLKKFLYVSSMAAVGPARGKHPLHELSASLPITTYGKSKLAGEQAIMFSANEFPVTVIRPSAIYGPRDTAILPFFKSAQKGIIPLVGRKPKCVSLVHVKDATRGIVDALESPNTANKTYFIGSEKKYSWDDIAEIVAECMGKKVWKIRIPEIVVLGLAALSGFVSQFSRKPSVLNFEKGKDMIQENWTCSIANAKKDFGYREIYSLEKGFRNTINWYRFMGWL